MDFFETVEKRVYVREFEEDPVPREHVERILEAVRLAPSAGNLQAYEVHVVTRDAVRRELAEACYGQDFVAQAPVVLVFSALPEESGREYGERGRRLYAVQDATIAAAYAQLAATALGYGSVWVGAFSPSRVKELVKAGGTPVAVIPIGVPAENPERPKRKTPEELFEWII